MPIDPRTLSQLVDAIRDGLDERFDVSRIRRVSDFHLAIQGSGSTTAAGRMQKTILRPRGNTDQIIVIHEMGFFFSHLSSANHILSFLSGSGTRFEFHKRGGSSYKGKGYVAESTGPSTDAGSAFEVSVAPYIAWSMPHFSTAGNTFSAAGGRIPVRIVLEEGDEFRCTFVSNPSISFTIGWAWRGITFFLKHP